MKKLKLFLLFCVFLLASRNYFLPFHHRTEVNFVKTSLQSKPVDVPVSFTDLPDEETLAPDDESPEKYFSVTPAKDFFCAQAPFMNDLPGLLEYNPRIVSLKLYVKNCVYRL